MSPQSGLTDGRRSVRGLPDRGFSGEIPPALMGEVISLSHSKSFTPNDIIHLTGDAVYLITHGGVIEEGGNWNPLFRGPGDLLGDIDLYDQHGGPHFARAVMLRTSCLVIPASRLRQFAAQRPEISTALYRALAQHVLRLGAWRAVDRLCSRARTAWLLLELSETLSSERRPADWVVGVNQEQMAQLVGLSRASVEKELRELRYDGAISTAYRKIHIVDRGRLATHVPPDFLM